MLNVVVMTFISNNRLTSVSYLDDGIALIANDDSNYLRHVITGKHFNFPSLFHSHGW
jgi:hypothetical protein